MKMKRMTAKVLIAAMLAGSFSVQADAWSPGAFAQMGEGIETASPGDAETEYPLSKSTDNDAEPATGSNAEFSWEEPVEGYLMGFQAEKGTLPSGAKVSVEVVDGGDYQLSEADQKQYPNVEIEKIAAFDICFWQNGEPIEPNSDVRVRIALDELYLDTNAYVASVKEENLSILKLDDVSDETIDFTIRENGVYHIGWLIEKKYPAFSCIRDVDGVQIDIQAEEGALPEGTEVVITPVKQSDIRDLVSAADGEELLAFDIQFLADGEEIQPLSDVKVTFTSKVIQKNAEVFHISDDHQMETVENTANEDGTAEFLAEHFSVYGIRQAAGYTAGSLGNPVYGGTADGDWKGNYVYYGWDYDDTADFRNHYYDMKDKLKEMGISGLYTWNGKKFMGSTERRPVKWRILHNDGGKLTLLSDQLIGTHNYDGAWDYSGITWENSDMREWLTEGLFGDTFTEEEQQYLLTMEVTDEVSEFSGLEAGPTTFDFITLPSRNDLSNRDYGFPAEGSCVARKADYSVPSYKNNNTANDTSYWTRDRVVVSYSYLYPGYVAKNGALISGGYRYNTWVLGVRPMVELDLDTEFMGYSEEDETIFYGLKFDCEEKWLPLNAKATLALEINGIDVSTLEWGSADENIVKIDENGNLSPVAVGTTYVYARSGNHFAGCKVEIRPESAEYKVVFKDGDQVVKEETVMGGFSAEAPNIEREGYTLSWDKSFDQVSSDLTVNAVWKIRTYKVQFIYNNEKGERVSATRMVEYGKAAEAPTIYGYVIKWNDSFDRITQAKVISGKTELKYYTISYELDGGKVSGNPEKYNVFQKVSLKNPIKDGWTFLFWKDMETETPISTIEKGSVGDKTLKAVWGTIPAQNKQYDDSDDSESVTNGWSLIDGTYYYRDSSGKPVTGRHVIDGISYNFDEKGQLLTKWMQTDGGMGGMTSADKFYDMRSYHISGMAQDTTVRMFINGQVSGHTGVFPVNDDGRTTSCTYHVINRLKAKGIALPVDKAKYYENGQRTSGQLFYALCGDNALHFEGPNALHQIYDQVALPVENIVLSMVPNHVVLIDKIDENGMVHFTEHKTTPVYDNGKWRERKYARSEEIVMSLDSYVSWMNHKGGDFPNATFIGALVLGK